MKALLTTITLSLVLVSANPISYRTNLMPHAQRVNQPCQWTDSISDGQVTGDSRLFMVIGDIQRYLDARHVRVNFLSDRYELYYKQTY